MRLSQVTAVTTVAFGAFVYQVDPAVLAELPQRLRGSTLFARVADLLCGGHMQVQRAPEPSDVLWENLQFSPWQQRGRQLLSTALIVAIYQTINILPLKC